MASLLPVNLPEPETDAFARAVTGFPAGIAGGMRLLARWSLPVELVGVAAMVTGVVLRLPSLATAGFVLAAAADTAAAQQGVRWTKLVALNGWGVPFRAAARSAILLAVLPNGYLVAVLGVQAALFGCLGVTNWLSLAQPPLPYRAGAATQSADTVAFARAYRRVLGVPWPLFGVEAAVAVALALWPDPGPDWLAGSAGAAIALAYAAFALWSARALRAGRGKVQERLLSALDEGRPTAMVYVSGGIGQSKYLVNQWLGALEALPAAPVLAVREASQLSPLAATGLPIVYAPHSRNVEALVRPTMRIGFFVANGPKNTDLWRDRELRHVFLGHGDSDKATSATPIARVYHEVWVAGRAGIDRYRAAGVDLPNSHFAIVGRPQVAGLAVGPLGHDRPVILYAPTFEGYYEESNYSSLLKMGPGLVRSLLREHPDAAIWFKPHPSTGAQRPEYLRARQEVNDLLRAAGGPHRCVDDTPGTDLMECLNSADLLISDISSVVSDFLYTERPVVVSNPQAKTAEEFRRLFPSQAAAYLLEADLANLTAVLGDALGADSLADARRELKRYVLGDLPEGPIAAFVAAAERLVARNRLPE